MPSKNSVFDTFGGLLNGSGLMERRSLAGESPEFPLSLRLHKIFREKSVDTDDSGLKFGGRSVNFCSTSANVENLARKSIKKKL